MDFEYCLAAGIIYPMIHVLSNYYVQKENWTMGMVVVLAFSHLFMKGIICGEKYKIGLLDPMACCDCMIFSIYTTEFYTLIVLIFVMNDYLNLNVVKSNAELFIMIQCFHFSAGLSKHSNIYTRLTFELLFIESVQKLGFLSRNKKLIIGISSVVLTLISFQVDYLKDVEYPMFFTEVFQLLLSAGIILKNLIYFVVLAKCLVFGFTVFILSKLLPSLSLSAVCLSLSFYVFSQFEKKVRDSRSFVHSKVHRKVLQVYFYDKKLRHVTGFLVFWILTGVAAFGYCEIKRFRYFEYFSGLVLSVLAVALAFMVSLDSVQVIKNQLFMNFVPISVSLVFVYLGCQQFL